MIEEHGESEETFMKMVLFSLGPITLHGYGFMIALGIAACLLLGTYRARKHEMNDEVVLDIAIYGLISGFLGAKLLYVIVEFDRFMADPMSVIGSEGFVVYGGIIAGVVAAIVYCKVKKISFLQYFDLLMPSVSVAQGFGRIGCLLAGCCYGRETTSALGIVFPEGCMAPAGVKLLPTQIFSSVGDFAIAAILVWAYDKRKRNGDIGILYMILYGIGRFVIEMLRSDARGGIGALSTSQWISILILVGAAILAKAVRKQR